MFTRLLDQTVNSAQPSDACAPAEALLERILEMCDALLIIFLKMKLLGLPQNSFEIGLTLIQVVLCPIKMLPDNPLQAPRPFPIPVVVYRAEYLALGILELGGDK